MSTIQVYSKQMQNIRKQFNQSICKCIYRYIYRYICVYFGRYFTMATKAKQNRGQTDLTQGSVTKGFLVFMIPIILGNIFTQLYNMVDSIIVGQYVGGSALAAVGASFSLTMMINAFLVSVGAGATVVVAQYYGAGNRENVDKTVNTAMIIAGIVAILITIIGLVTAAPVLHLIKTPDEIFDDALTYYVIIVLGTIGHLYYQMSSAILRGIGDSVWPLGLLIFCSILNIGLDLLFVAVFGMGVAGAAWATILAQLISAVAVVIRLCGKNYNITVKPSTLRIHPDLAKSILMIGVPAGLQQFVTSAGSTVVQTFTNGFGTNIIAANNTIIKIDGFIILPMMAIGTAATTFVGQNIGAGKHDRLKKGNRLSIILACAIAFILGIVLMIIAPWAVRLFTSEHDIIYIGMIGLRTLGLFYIFTGLIQSMTGIIRGAGDSTIPMFSAFLNIGVRIVMAYVLAFKTGDYKGLYYAMIAGNMINAGLLCIYYFSGRWRRSSLIKNSDNKDMDKTKTETANN